MRVGLIQPEGYPCLALTATDWFGFFQFGSVQFSSIQFSSVQFSLVQLRFFPVMVTGPEDTSVSS